MSSIRFAFATAVLVISCGCGSSYSSPSGPSNPAPTTPTITGTQVAIVSGASTRTTTAYAPNPVTLAVGGTITWVNNDNTPHTSTGDNGAWNSGSISAGATFTRTFSTAGSFTYHCTIHPGMVGTVTVQ
jgi:plastocyanin